MKHYRKTKATIDLSAIRRNVKKIIATYPDYAYYLGVIKANCYGLGGEPVIRAILEGGCNYLCVSLAEEALEVRARFPDVPILVLVPSFGEALSILREKDVAVTVTNLEQAKEAGLIPDLKIFIRANGGHDIFGGPTDRQGFETLFTHIKHSRAVLQGIYLHNYYPENEQVTHREYATFEMMTQGMDLDSVPIVSTSNSLSLPRYAKKSICNACRIGNMIYGIENETLDLENCFVLTSEITQIVHLRRGESISYANAYTAQAPEEYLGVVPIGFGDGFAKTNVGRDVFIGDRRYQIIAVTMDITLLLVDEQVKQDDTVLLVRDTRHLDEIAAHTGGVAEETICLLNKRIPRTYLE